MRIKAIRQEKGLTQVELAKRAKISPIYLAQIEGGAKNRRSARRASRCWKSWRKPSR